MIYIPKFIVVVHVKDSLQAVADSKLALNNGAGGIFLINHQTDFNHLLVCYDMVRESLPNAWIGLNFLDCNAFSAIENRPEDCNAIWVDDCYINTTRFEFGTKSVYNLFSNAIELGMNESWSLFGSVAFKYQKPEPDPKKAASLCSRIFGVTVTSGSGTGEHADIEKIKQMKKGCREHPLCLASGVTADNVYDYINYVNCFMVATGVSDENDNLVPEKIEELAELIDSYEDR